MKYARLLREHFSAFPAFTARDVRIFFSKKGLGQPYAKVLLHALVRNGELHRVTRGAYSFRDDPLAAGFAFQPFYYGLQEALSLRGLWEQETNPVVVTTRKVRAGVRSFAGSNYVVRRVARPLFFGFEPFQAGDAWIPVSTPEKTLIDFVYFREPLPRSALAELRKRVDAKKLAQDLQRTPAWAARRIRKLVRVQ